MKFTISSFVFFLVSAGGSSEVQTPELIQVVHLKIRGTYLDVRANI